MKTALRSGLFKRTRKGIVYAEAKSIFVRHCPYYYPSVIAAFLLAGICCIFDKVAEQHRQIRFVNRDIFGDYRLYIIINILVFATCAKYSITAFTVLFSQKLISVSSGRLC